MEDLPIPIEVAPPLPTWRAAPGDSLAATLSDWAREEGWTVIANSDVEWRINAPVAITADFEQAAAELVSGFSRATPQPVARMFPNKVIVLEGPTDG